MTKVTYQGQCEAAARARAVLTREIRVFHRSKAGDGGSFVKTVDLGVMSYRKYKALRDNETDLEAYVGCYVDCGEGYEEFVAFYLNEVKEQGRLCALTDQEKSR